MKLTDDELTRLVAEKVMGCGTIPTTQDRKFIYLQKPDETGLMFASRFNPMNDLNDAHEVIEAMRRKGWSCRIALNSLANEQNGVKFYRDYLGLGENIFHANYDDYGSDHRVYTVQKTFPRAICHAALLAVGVKEEEL